MTKNFEKIINLIKQSSLSLEDKADLIFLFSLSKKDVDLDPVIQLCSANPEWINTLNDNYKAKYTAFTTQSPALWDKIIEEEERQLNKFES